MTEKQVIEIFSKMRPVTRNVWVTYYKELPLADTSQNPFDYYKVVTRNCAGDYKYYHSQMGRDSLAKGNPKTNLKGTTGHYKDAEGNDIRGIYTTSKGMRIRFYPNENYEDKILFYVKGKRVDISEVQNLVNKGILSSDALRTKPTNNYMTLYLPSIINIVLKHKDGSEDVGDNHAPRYVAEFTESLKESNNMEFNRPNAMMTDDEKDVIFNDVKESVCEDYGWEISADEAMEYLDKLKNEIGCDELLDNIALALGNEKLAEVLAYIARQFDLSDLFNDEAEYDSNQNYYDDYDDDYTGWD